MVGFLKKIKKEDSGKNELEQLKAELARLKEDQEKKDKQEIKTKEATPETLDLDDDVFYDQEEGDDFNDFPEDNEEEEQESTDNHDDLYKKMGQYLAAAMDLYIAEMTKNDEE